MRYMLLLAVILLAGCPSKVQEMILTEKGSGEYWKVITTPATIQAALSVYEVYTAPSPLFGTGIYQVGGVLDKLPDSLEESWNPVRIIP